MKFHAWYYNGQKTMARAVMGPRIEPDFVILLDSYAANVPYKYLCLCS